ncbi:syncoilin-like [Huso huso]|uniref:Syncoilin-like n=1 Tax=Huso huso TaxID=61971 RepID=A0ABR0YP90_HUSHU
MEVTEPADSITETDIMEELGNHFQKCIDEVDRLVAQRESLAHEIIVLQEPMLREIRALHGELTAAWKQKAKAELECHSLREEVRLVKWSLFKTTRECVQCQYTLENQRHDVAQFSISQEELQNQVCSLSEELLQLKAAQQQRLDQFRQILEHSRRPRGSLDLTDCRRLSLDFESYLKDSRKSVEEFYEPKVVSLLKRRQASMEDLRRTREQAEDLKDKLGPLKREVEVLSLQRTCLEERVMLIQRKRDEDVLQYRETLERLEESIRELKTEVQLQQRKKKEMETLKNSLSQELTVYKGCIEVYENIFTATEKPKDTKKELS